MELFLDSIKFNEVQEANDLGFLTGLTTTPTFMQREGITDVDSVIIRLSKMTKILMVESLGNNAGEIIKEAERLLSLGLNKETTVFKIPITLEGAKACKILTDKGLKVNLHLIYTLQQAYVAYCAGATYICPLVGRLQDQGHDALDLVDQCVTAAERYGYKTKVMFSSVRSLEHVRNAINLGAHACTVPWNVLKQLCQNHFTELGIRQFVEHTEMSNIRASDLVKTDEVFLSCNSTVLDALIQMTKSKTGATIIINEQGNIYRVFTDGDLRRLVEHGQNNLISKKFTELEQNSPISVQLNASLPEITNLFKTKEVDNIVVVEGNKPIGIIDIQDVLKWI
jgi:TalC/MipB family fructose-6-phosphate aldolase